MTPDFKNSIKFEVVREFMADEFSRAVQSRLQAGWALHGTTGRETSGLWYQAMTKGIIQ